MLRFYLAGLLSLLFFSFSGATTVDWDRELQKLVSEKTKIDVLKYISQQDIRRAYEAWRAGSYSGKLLKFFIRTSIWTGFFYLASEQLFQYLQQKVQQLQQSLGQFGYVNGYCYCVTYLSCSSQVSTSGSYVYTSFASAPNTPLYSLSQGIPGQQYCYVNFDFWDGNTTLNRNTSGYFESSFLSELQSHICPNSYDTSSCSQQSQTQLDELTALDQVLSDSANFPEIQNLISQAPATVSPYEIPDSDAFPLSSHPNDQIRVVRDNGDGTQTVATPDSTTVEQNPAYDPQNPPAPSQEDYSFSAPDVSLVDFDTNVDVPERKSISQLLSQKLQSIPILQALKQVKIQGSGSCTFSVPISLPGASGSGTIDFCQFAGVLSTLGSIVLIVAHIFAIYIVFKGD